VHDFGEIDGVLYIDMRLVEAPREGRTPRRRALPVPRTVSIIRPGRSRAGRCARAGLVHRDIKPENVLLAPDDFAYLVDFGIAHGEARRP